MPGELLRKSTETFSESSAFVSRRGTPAAVSAAAAGPTLFPSLCSTLACFIHLVHLIRVIIWIPTTTCLTSAATGSVSKTHSGIDATPPAVLHAAVLIVCANHNHTTQHNCISGLLRVCLCECVSGTLRRAVGWLSGVSVIQLCDWLEFSTGGGGRIAQQKDQIKFDLYKSNLGFRSQITNRSHPAQQWVPTQCTKVFSLFFLSFLSCIGTCLIYVSIYI